MRSNKLLFVLLLALPLAGQTADTRPASVQGTVVNSVSGAPIPRVHITLQDRNEHDNTQRVRYGTTSGVDGRFSLTGLPPGSYAAFGERVGFVASHSPYTSITLKPDDDKTVEIRLVPTGAINGRVTDSDGEPVERALVSAEGRDNGGGRLAMTDENGHFRIGGLAPGKYNILAAHGDIFDERPEIRTDGTADIHHAATYYPGVLTEKEAGKIAVRAGDETNGIEIQMLRVPFVRVSGNVIDLPKNAEQPRLSVSEGPSSNGTPLRQDGSFEIWRLSPGKYTLSAEWSIPNGDNVRTSVAEIEVAGSNIDHIELRAVPDSDIPGRLEFEDEEARKADSPAQTVSLTALDYGDDTEPVPIDAGGAFRLDKVPPGKYAVNVSWGTAYIKSMRLGTTLIEGNALDLRNGSGGSDLSVLISSETGSVAGVVRSDGERPEGAMVVLRAADGESQFEPRETQIAADGTYTITGLPPGKYKLVAAAEIQGMQGTDIFGYEDQMETVEIVPKDKITKDLRLRTPADR